MSQKSKVYQATITLILCSLSFGVHAEEPCTLTMGYKDIAKELFMDNPPSDEGIYKVIYTEAAKKIGCKLNIVRFPKKRVYVELEKGTLDFYPGTSPSAERNAFMVFFSSGLVTGNAIVTRPDVPEITDVKNFKTPMTLLIDATTSIQDDEEFSHFKMEPIKRIDIEKAVDLLLKKRGDMYKTNRIILEDYLHKHPEMAKSIKIHSNCCTEDPTLTGFSQKSKYFKAQKNNAFDPSKPVTPENFPLEMIPSSKAAQFRDVLAKMYKDGTTRRLMLEEIKRQQAAGSGD